MLLFAGIRSEAVTSRNLKFDQVTGQPRAVRPREFRWFRSGGPLDRGALGIDQLGFQPDQNNVFVRRWIWPVNFRISADFDLLSLGKSGADESEAEHECHGNW